MGSSCIPWAFGLYLVRARQPDLWVLWVLLAAQAVAYLPLLRMIDGAQLAYGWLCSASATRAEPGAGLTAMCSAPSIVPRMDPTVLNVLADYERRAAEEGQTWSKLSFERINERIDEWLLFVGPDTAKLMHMLAVSAKAQVLVEIGASYGYSTVWLADAARATGGKLHSLELSPTKVEYARAQLRRAGLESYVEFHVGDARESLVALSGPFDFVLLDLWKDLYIPCFDLFHPKLAQGAFVVADNMLFPPPSRPQAEQYRARVKAAGDLDSVLLPIGSGIELSKKR